MLNRNILFFFRVLTIFHFLVFSESLFNAFATAAFFKFVVFSIFEMRYLLTIWKASRPANSGEGWEAMRRELSLLYSRFCEFSVTIIESGDPLPPLLDKYALYG